MFTAIQVGVVVGFAELLFTYIIFVKICPPSKFS